MGCYSLYSINFYNEATDCIDKFLKKYPANQDIIYAEYLKSIIFFEQISDEVKRLRASCLKQINKLIIF